MSGIAAIFNRTGEPVSAELLAQMTRFMSYRGPDAQRTWSRGPVGLGQALLRTTDEAAREQQPYSLDGQVWITADVRLDGRAALIRELQPGTRCALNEATDPELILHA